METQEVKRFIKADKGKLSQVLEWESGARVEIPINKDGSVKYFDDSKLLKEEYKQGYNKIGESKKIIK